MSWFMYIVECSDGSLYTGSSNNVERRVKQHNDGKGAKYTKNRRPVCLRAFWAHENRSEACKAEAKFKKLKKSEKIEKIKIKLQIDSYVRKTIKGQRLTEPEDLQFYENYKEEIEAELLRIYNLNKGSYE